MDLDKTIRQLHVELAMINEAILCFERLEASSSAEYSESSTVEKKGSIAEFMGRIGGSSVNRRQRTLLHPTGENQKQNVSDKERHEAFCALPLVGSGH